MVKFRYKVKETTNKIKGVIKMKTKEQLITYYEKQLEKVISTYGNDDRKIGYVQCAKDDLEAVKNGREW